MAGYFFSKSAISCSMSGTQVQNVSSVGGFIALSMSAWPTALAEEAESPSLPPQAVSAAPSDTAPVAVRKSRRLIWEVLGVNLALCMVNSRQGLRERAEGMARRAGTCATRETRRAVGVAARA
jgi:hypothetical protein